MSNPTKKYLSPTRAGQLIGVSHHTVNSWVKRGRLKAHAFPSGRYRQIDPDDLAALLRGLGWPEERVQCVYRDEPGAAGAARPGGGGGRVPCRES